MYTVMVANPEIVGHTTMLVGVGKLCWHNFENNRYKLALENNASILGTN